MPKKKEKESKKKIFIYVFIAIFALLAVAGYFTGGYIIKDDKFVVLGEKEITINVGEEFNDYEKPVTIIAFKKDISNKVKSYSNLDNLTEGDYYIKYTVNNIRYRNVARYRIIHVVSEGSTANENS